MSVTSRNILGLSAIAATIGLTLWDTQAAAPIKPASRLVCEFSKAHNKLVIRNTANDHITAAMFEAVNVENRAVTGAGGIYPKPNEVGIETGIQFKADFAARTCEAKHSKDSFGYNAVSAPMVSDLKAYTYTVK